MRMPLGDDRYFDHPILVTAGNNVYMEAATWDYDPVLHVAQPQKLNVIALMGSEDRGQSFVPYGIVGPDNLGRNSMTPVALPDGSILMAYYDHPNGQPLTSGRIYVVKMAETGHQVGTPQFVTDVKRSAAFGALGADRSHGPHRGRVYAAVETGQLPNYFTPNANATATGPRAIAVMFSDNEGQLWSAPVTITAADGGPAFFATIAINKDVVVAAVWLQHDLETLRRFCYRAYISISSDGGSTFSPPQVVSSALSCPDAKENVAVRYPPNDQGVVERFPRGGDYIGLTASTDGTFHVAWADGRDGLFQIYTASAQVVH